MIKSRLNIVIDCFKIEHLELTETFRNIVDVYTLGSEWAVFV